MKTHDIAKALTQLGKVLRSLPNQELDELGSTLSTSTREPSKEMESVCRYWLHYRVSANRTGKRQPTISIFLSIFAPEMLHVTLWVRY